MAQEEFQFGIDNGKKMVVVTGVAGPASYATNGFTTRVNSLRSIDKVVSITVTTARAVADLNMAYNLSTITGNAFLTKAMEQTVTAAGTMATWAEVAAMGNLSAVIFTFIVIGD